MIDENIKRNIRHAAEHVFEFIKNPIHQINHLPTWSLKHTIFVQIAMCLGCGFLSGLIVANFYYVMYGLIIFPIVVVTVSFLMALILYYYFQVFERREISYTRLYLVVVFANIPFLLLSILSYLVPPVSLVGFAMTGLILVVALHQLFQMQKRRAIRLVGAMYLVILIIWILDRFDLARMAR